MVAEKAKLVYANDDLIDSTNTVWLQWGFYVLIGLFEQAEVACQPRTISGRHSAAVYKKRMNGEGYPKRVRQQQRVVCG